MRPIVLPVFFQQLERTHISGLVLVVVWELGLPADLILEIHRSTSWSRSELTPIPPNPCHAQF